MCVVSCGSCNCIVVLVVVVVVCMYVLSFDTDCYIPRWCSDMEDNDEEGEDDLEDALSEFEAADKVRTVYYSVVDCVSLSAAWVMRVSVCLMYIYHRNYTPTNTPTATVLQEDDGEEEALVAAFQQAQLASACNSPQQAQRKEAAVEVTEAAVLPEEGK